MSIWLGFWPSSLREYLSFVMRWAWNFLVRRKRYWEDLPLSPPRADSMKVDADETETQPRAVLVTRSPEGTLIEYGKSLRTHRRDGEIYIPVYDLAKILIDLRIAGVPLESTELVEMLAALEDRYK